MQVGDVRVGLASVPMLRPMGTAIHAATHTHNALVEIHADGLVGQGAALTLSAGQAKAVCCVLSDMAELLVGRDPREIRSLWDEMRRMVNLTGATGLSMLAISAIDTALWDLHARAAQQPLFRLLGGSAAPLPVYTQPGWLVLSIDELVEEALMAEEEGFMHYKMRAGSPDWRSDLERVQRVRQECTESMGLLVDANQGWSRIDARAAALALDELDLFWLEEPVDAADVDGMARLAAAIDTPLAAGEGAFGAPELRPLIESAATDVLMLDLQHCGGPTGFLMAATQAQLAGLPISNHLFTEASIHLLAACPNSQIVEHMPGWWDELFDRPLLIEDGTIRPSEDPGIGARFREDAAGTLRSVL